MNKFAISGVLSLCLSSAALAQPDFQEGVHYIKLNKAESARKPEVVTVTEVFSYGCHACNEFEPHMQNWKKRQNPDVRLNRVPVGFGRHAWELMAKGYMIAEILGVEEAAHVPMMEAIWKEGKQMRSLEEIADFYALHGADRDKFLAMDGSFMLSMRQNQNQEKLGLYAIRGTPTMIVNDKYKVQTGQSVPTYEAMLIVVDHLVNQERALFASANEGGSAEEAATATN